MPDPIKYGVIGCGGIAQSHLSSLGFVPELELVATCDIDPSRARAAADQFGASKVFTEYQALAADPDVQAVSICLPHHLHRAPTVACAQGGKHVLCEKPMETTLADADAMIAAADEAGTVLMVGQVLRFRPANRMARQMILEGAIGQPVNLMRRRLSWHKEYPRAPWSASPEMAGGWVLYGYGSHEVDQLLWLTDSPAATVYAAGRRNNAHWDDYDEITIQMALANGAMATQQHSTNCHFGAWDCLVVGTESSMRIETHGLVVGEQQYEAPLPDGGGMREQIAEFARAISEGREPEASGHNVRHTMVALEAAKMSIATGRIVDATQL